MMHRYLLTNSKNNLSYVGETLFLPDMMWHSTYSYPATLLASAKSAKAAAPSLAVAVGGMANSLDVHMKPAESALATATLMNDVNELERLLERQKQAIHFRKQSRKKKKKKKKKKKDKDEKNSSKKKAKHKHAKKNQQQKARRLPIHIADSAEAIELLSRYGAKPASDIAHNG
jgi:hypothetical protein